MTEGFRFIARLIATPILFAAFGFFWIGFVVILAPLFAIFSFLERESFSWKEQVEEANEFFCEPFVSMWGRRR